MPIFCNGTFGRRRIAGDRYARRDIGERLDDRRNRPFELSGRVYISLLFWGWLWGIWGMLLSIPIIVIVKVVSQRVEQLHAMAKLLGD